MYVIALRPEYQLLVDRAKNRVFYQNFEQMQGAVALPNYLADWTAVLDAVQPGFCIVSDKQIMNQTSPDLQSAFLAVEQLIVQRGVQVVAEVHMPGQHTRSYSEVVSTSRTLPVHHFMQLWEADHFLDCL